MSLTSDISKFIGLAWPERFLFLEAFLFLGVCRLLIIVLPFKTIVRLLKLKEGEASATSETLPLFLSMVSWAIAAAASRTPWGSVCLGQGLAGMIMLKRRSMRATLYLGVAKDNDGMAAHAWLRCGDFIVTGASGHERYAVISSYRCLSVISK